MLVVYNELGIGQTGFGEGSFYFGFFFLTFPLPSLAFTADAGLLGRENGLKGEDGPPVAF